MIIMLLHYFILTVFNLEKMQLREYIDDTEDYINIQVDDVEIEKLNKRNSFGLCMCPLIFAKFFQLDNHRNQLIQVLDLFLSL